MTGDEGFRPPARVRPLALAIFRRPDGAVLLAPGYDEVKQQRFYRPLGGEIEFGETAEAAARREIREEIGAEVAEMRLVASFENIFTYRGAPGHELVWVFEGTLADAALYDCDSIKCTEGESVFEARWVPLGLFERGEAPLYPEGLLEALGAKPERYDDGMGMTFVDIEVANVAAPDTRETVRFLVDSGATYSVVPAGLLERLGIEPHSEQGFRLANGERVVRRKGTALFKLGDRTGGADVLFGQPGDSNLLGTFTLEALGLALDPLRRELRELPLMLAEDTMTEP